VRACSRYRIVGCEFVVNCLVGISILFLCSTPLFGVHFFFPSIDNAFMGLDGKKSRDDVLGWDGWWTLNPNGFSVFLFCFFFSV
jgi:hypothetical protein